MRLQRLQATDFRIFERLELEPGPGWNLFVGPNGSGKTSILEAAFLLSHGRSFRSALREALVRRGAGSFAVYGEVAGTEGLVHRLGLGRGGRGLEARVDGSQVPAMELLQRVAVVCFEPGSHELMAGPGEGRRRFLDWGVFHVEHRFMATWRRYQRALRQRNHLLRSDGLPEEFDAWEHELASSGEALTVLREEYLARLKPWLLATCGRLLPEMGEAALEFDRGWDGRHALEVALGQRRERDKARGHTGAGPHRADWHLRFANAPRREHLSRGQQKLAALACVLAQARLHGEGGRSPVLCLDDLASEVDQAHQERVLAELADWHGQVLATALDVPPAPAAAGHDRVMFHVEQGCVRRIT